MTGPRAGGRFWARAERTDAEVDYRIREIDRIEEFEALAGAWDACLRRSACDSPFLTSAWLCAWWRAHGRGRELRVVCAYAGDRLVAAAPLCARRARYYLTPVKEICFVGDLTSDRQDFLAEPDHAAALAAIWRRLRAQPRGCALVRLEELPEASATVAAGREAWPGLESEPSSLLPYLPVRRGWAEYEATLSRRFRSEMRTRPKVFDEWGAWKHEVLEGPAILGALDEVIAVEAVSAKAAAGRAFFHDRRNADFLRRLLAAPGPIRPLLFTLRVEGKLVSYIIGLVYEGVYYAYNGTYLPGYEKGSVGKWLFHQTVRHAFENGLTGFDFLRGASFLKTRWSPPEERRHVRAVAFAPGPVGGALRWAVFRARPWLKARRPSPPSDEAPAPRPAQAAPKPARGPRVHSPSGAAILKSLAGAPAFTGLAARRLHHPVIVLCYHDLRENGAPDSWLSVSCRDFAAQLDWLAGIGHFLRPGELLDPERHRPDRLNLLVTFDDGKPSLPRLAAPLLRARGVPALFCLSTWHVESGEPFWFDRVVTPIQVARLGELDLRDHGLRHYTLRPGPPADRWEDLQTLLQEMKALAPEDAPATAAVVTEIERASGLSPDDLRERQRPLTWREAAELAGDELFACGSHAHRHRILTRLDDAGLETDLRTSRELLGRRLGREPDAIAYPNGDHDERVRETSRRAGFRLGLTTRPALAGAAGDPLAVPRLLVGGYDGLSLLRFKLNKILVPAALSAPARSG